MSDNLGTPAAADTAQDAPTIPAEGSSPPANWRDALPEDIRAAPSMQKYDSLAALAKGHLEAEKLIGRKGVILPGENASPEELKQFHAALGVPETVEGYELKAPEGVPEGVWNDDAAKGFAAKAHELGLTPKQVQGLAAWQVKNVAEAMGRQGLEADGRSWEDTLKGEWGAEFDAKLDTAKRAVRQFGGEPGALEAFENRAGGAAMVRMFAKIGAAIGEDSAAGIGGTAGGVSAKSQIEQLTSDPKGPYWDALHPEHRATVARVTELYRVAGA